MRKVKMFKCINHYINWVLFVVSLLLSVVVVAESSLVSDDGEVFITETYVDYEFDRYIEIPVKAKPDLWLYKRSTFAIKITGMVADGVEVKPKHSTGNIASNLAFQTTSNQFIYKLNLKDLFLGDLYVEKEHLSPRYFSYDIPENFDELIIKYQLKYPELIESEKKVIEHLDPQKYILRLISDKKFFQDNFLGQEQ